MKLDQTFVHEIEDSPRDRAIISAVISMAHGLGLRVTAEGVESELQLDFLICAAAWQKNSSSAFSDDSLRSRSVMETTSLARCSNAI